MENSTSRFNKIASNYATSEVHVMSPTIAKLHELIGSSPAMAVCDVACGAGHTGLSFAGSAARIVGVDPSTNMLAQFRSLAETKGVAVEGVESYAESILLPDDSFDLVVSRLAPHHFTDIKRAVEEMKRIAKPGGAVAIIDLEGDPDPACDEFNHRLEILHDPTHVRSYTTARWVSFFEGAGLIVEKVDSQLTERPGGVPLRRWCEIASSGDEAEKEIRRLLTQAPDEMLATLGITQMNGEFMMPIRTLLLIGRKPGRT